MTEQGDHPVTASQEDYLEAIHALSEQGGSARVSDIAERIGDVAHPGRAALLA